MAMAAGAMGMAHLSAGISLEKQVEAHSGNQNPRQYAEKGIQLFRQDVLLRVKRDSSKQIHARRMGDGHNQSQQERVPRRAFRSHQVSRDDCLAMSRFQCMQRAKSSSDEGRKECDPNTDLLRGHQLRERTARSLLTVGCDLNPGLRRRRRGNLRFLALWHCNCSALVM